MNDIDKIKNAINLLRESITLLNENVATLAENEQANRESITQLAKVMMEMAAEIREANNS